MKRPLLNFFVDILSPQKRYVAGLLATALMLGIITSVSPYLLKCLIDTMMQPIAHPRDLYFWGFIYVGIFFMGAINLRASDWLRAKLIPTIRTDIVQRLFRSLHQKDTEYYQLEYMGNVSSKIRDMASGFIVILTLMELTFANSCTLVIAIISLFFVLPQIACILSFWAALFFILTLRYASQIQGSARQFSQSSTYLYGGVVDRINNIKNMWLFNTVSYEEDRLQKELNDLKQEDTRLQIKVLHLKLIQDGSVFLLMSAVMFSLIRGYHMHQISMGELVFTLMLLRYIVQYIWFLASQWVNYSEEVGKCENALTLLSKDRVDIDSKSHIILNKEIQVKGNVYFHKVDFSYEPDRPVFNHLELRIQAGEKVGVVGLSGSGKSTLFRLLVKLHDVQSGAIYIDDMNINDISSESVRDVVSVVSPEMGLFHRSIEENIRYGKLSATMDEIIDAAKAACCHDFIMKLPLQYRTVIGEKGDMLSTGQKQRITLARALLRQSSIIVLDEATSALDPIHADLLTQQLGKVLENKTCILISHHLKTLRYVDRVVVFQDGHIIESGAHDTLLAAGGVYAKFWSCESNSSLMTLHQRSMC